MDDSCMSSASLSEETTLCQTQSLEQFFGPLINAPDYEPLQFDDKRSPANNKLIHTLPTPALTMTNGTKQSTLSRSKSKPAAPVIKVSLSEGVQKATLALQELPHNVTVGEKHGTMKRSRPGAKRVKKTAEQIRVLWAETAGVGDELPMARKGKIAALTGLSEGQVYKWFWDNRIRKHTSESQVGVNSRYCL